MLFIYFVLLGDFVDWLLMLVIQHLQDQTTSSGSQQYQPSLPCKAPPQKKKKKYCQTTTTDFEGFHLGFQVIQTSFCCSPILLGRIKNQSWNSWSLVRSPSHVIISSLLNHYSVFANCISAYLCQNTNTNICLSLYVCSQTPSHPSTSHRTICHPHVICPLSYLDLLIHLEWHKYVHCYKI